MAGKNPEIPMDRSGYPWFVSGYYYGSESPCAWNVSCNPPAHCSVCIEIFGKGKAVEMKRNVNILFVCRGLSSQYHEGIDSQTWNLSQSLIRMGHEVTILCIGGDTECENSYIQDSVVITRIPYFLGAYINPSVLLGEEYFFYLSARKWINKNKDEFDVVHLEGSKGYSVADENRSKSLVSALQTLPVPQ